MNVKPFLVLFFFAFLMVSFARGAIGDTDLTPDTPPAASGSNTSSAFAPAVMGGQTSLCGGLYTVRSGDTLSEIARACNIKLADLISANPQITNPDLIHIDQQINIPYGTIQSALPVAETPVQVVIAATATPVEATAIIQEVAPAVATSAPTSNIIISAFETARAPDSGTQYQVVVPTSRPNDSEGEIGPGSLVEVSVTGLPANAAVTVGIGQVDSEPFLVDERITDDNGILRVAVPVPANALPNQKWTITVTTMYEPIIRVTAVPFVIER